MPDTAPAPQQDVPVCEVMAKFLDNCGFLHIQPRSGFPLEIMQFWQYVGRYPLSASGFLINLTARLISLETSHGARPLELILKELQLYPYEYWAKQVPKLTIDQGLVAKALQQCIVLTQYYVLLYHPIQAGSKEANSLYMRWQQVLMEELLVNIKNVSNNQKDQIEWKTRINVATECEKRVLRAMSTNSGLRDTHKFLDVRNLVGWCCRNCTFGNVGRPPPPFNINTNAACESLHYPYLCHRVSTSQEDGITVLIFIVQQLSRVEDTAVVASLLTIFTDTLSLVPHVPESLLSTAYNTILSLVTWPAPHAQMAHHLLDLLYVELRVPGCAFREQLLSSNHLNLKRSEHVYYTLDTSVDNACQFHEQIQLTAPVNQEQVLRAFIVHSCSSLGQNKISYLKQALQGLNMDDLQILSCLIYDIQGQYARTEELGKARKDLEEMLFSVFHNIISDAPCTKDLYQAPTSFMQFLAFDSSIPIHASRALENIIYSVRDSVVHSAKHNRPYIASQDAGGSMMSYEVKSLASSFSNGRCSRSGSISEHAGSEVGGVRTERTPSEALSADSISIQISNLLDGFQEFLEPEQDETLVNEETLTTNLMKYKSNRDSAESEDTGFGSGVELDLDNLSDIASNPGAEALSPRASLCDNDNESLLRQNGPRTTYPARSSISSSSVFSHSSGSKRSNSWQSDSNLLSVTQLVTDWVAQNKHFIPNQCHDPTHCLRCGKPHDTVKIALVGSDRTVAAMATSYSEMLSQSTKKCGKLDFEFFYIPLRTHTVPQKNIEVSQYKVYIKSEYNLSDYLCHMDPLYAQRLFYPVHTVLRILPSIKPCPDTQEFERACRDPASILRSSVNGYLNHSQSLYNLSLYRVELWKNEVNYTVLTMTQWLEVGFPVTVHHLPEILDQKNKKRRKSMKTKDLKLSSIDLAFKPPELYLGIDKSTVSGTSNNVTLPGATYWSIVASNVARPELNQDTPPDPQSEALNIRVIEAVRKNKSKGPEFLPSEHIRSFTIKGLHIESESNFDVVIDHYKYTNIKKLHVSTWHSSPTDGSKDIKFPLKLWSQVDH